MQLCDIHPSIHICMFSCISDATLQVFCVFLSSNHELNFSTFLSYSVNIKKHKQRLDEFCQEKFPQYSRTQIQSWILQGEWLLYDREI